MIYILDTNFFIKSFKNLSRNVFEDIWEPLVDLMQQGRVVTSDTVYDELVNFFSEDDVHMQWLKPYNKIFKNMTNNEAAVLSQIFLNPIFRQGVKEKSIRLGRQESDAIIVAKAKILEGVIVTNESDEKPNSEKVPMICKAFDVLYMSGDEFYKVLRNLYNSRDELFNVVIKGNLVNSPFKTK